MSDEDEKKTNTSSDEEEDEDVPDFGKIVLATFAGILILGGITFAGYSYTQHQAAVKIGCSKCAPGVYVKNNDWDLKKHGTVQDCEDACRAFFGPKCDGNSSCRNPGSTDPGNCCSCVTKSGDSCDSLIQ